MVDFTREIKATEKKASATPQATPATGNVIADVAGVANLGLQLYAKKQSEEKLFKLKTQEAEHSRTIADGAMKLVDLQNDLAYGQKAAPRVIQKKVKEFFSAYDAETAFEIRSAANKMTRGSTSDTLRQARIEREAQLEFETKAATGAAEAGYSLPSDASPEQMQQAIIDGEVAKAEHTAKMNAYAVADAVRSTKENEDRAWVADASFMFSRAIGRETSSWVQAQGGLTDGNVGDMVAYLESQKAQLSNRFQSEFLRQGVEAGRRISDDARKSAVDLASSTIDRYIDYLSNTKTLKAMQNNVDVMFTGNTWNMLTSETDAVRRAAIGAISAKEFGLPRELTNFNNFNKFAAKALEGTIDTASPTLSQDVKSLVGSLSPLDPAKASDRFDFVDDIIESLLNGTTKNVKAVVASGGYDSLTRKLSEEGSQIVNPETAQEHIDNLTRVGSKVLASQIMRSTTVENKGYSEFSAMSKATSDRVGFDIDLFQLVPTTDATALNSDQRNTNRLIEQHLKALEQLAASEGDIEKFKLDVIESLGVSPRGKN